MIGEYSFYGVYFPWLIVLAVIALLVLAVLRRLAARLGVYRFVWHPALFDVAVFVIVLYLVVLVSPHVFSR